MSHSATLWPAGMASRVSDREAIHAEFGTGGKGHAGNRHVVGGVQVDSGILGVGDFGDFDEHFGSLFFQIQFAVGHFGVDVQAAVDGMDPETIAIVRDRNIGGPIDDNKVVVGHVR